MTELDEVSKILSDIDADYLEIMKKHGSAKKRTENIQPVKTKTVEPVKKEAKESIKPITKTEVKTAKKENAAKPVKVKKARKAKKEKANKDRKNLKFAKNAAAVIATLVLGGGFIFASGVVQNAIEKHREEKFLSDQKVLSSSESLANRNTHRGANVEVEGLDTEEVTEPEDVEYISGELFENGYNFNQDITPGYLKRVNPGLSTTTSYLEIPGTKINYEFVFPNTEYIDWFPGLREEINKSGYTDTEYMNMYYLHHSMDDMETEWGTLYQDIYTQPLNQHSDKLSDMSVIYGHHMKDKSMLTGLDNWKKDKDGIYGSEHPFGVIYTDDGLCYKLTFITSRVVSGNDAYSIHAGDFNSVEEKQAFINEVIAQAQREGNFTLDSYDVDENTKFMSLVTCSYEEPNNRYVLIGVLEKAAIKDIYIDGYEIGKEKER